MKRFYQRIVQLLASSLFGYAVIALAAIQAAWVAVSSRFPMAFDEAYHYGLINLHAQTLSPILTRQPPGPAPYGAVTRDPSQLYHWLLSWPARLFDTVGANQVTKIVLLRLCSTALFCWGLYLFRKLLLRTKASPAAVNASLLFFVLIPTVPLVSGQLNYDNLQFPLVALALLLVSKLSESIKANKLPLGRVITLTAVCLVGTLSKFSFLPILAGVVVYEVWLLVRVKRLKLVKTLRQSVKEWCLVKTSTKWLPVAVLAVASGLFLWFYGVNMAVYRNPVVQCHQVIAASRCSSFEPWNRNHLLAQQQFDLTHNPIKFTIDWQGGMFYRLFFVINGATGAKRYTNMVAMPMAIAAALLAVCGVVLAVRYAAKILRHDPALRLVLFVGLIYLASLWGRNYNDFLHLGQEVAINGRYLHPVLLPIILLLVASYQRAFRLMPEVKLTILLVALAMFAVGGGITGFIHYSDTDWYFEGRPLILQLNEWARRLTSPLWLGR